MMKKNQRKKMSQQGVTLQITKLPPDVYQQLKVYEVTHGNMEHHEVFTKAFLLLLASEQPE